MRLKYFNTFLIIFITCSTGLCQLNFWSPQDNIAFRLGTYQRDIQPSVYDTYYLDFNAMYAYVQQPDSSLLLKIPVGPDEWLDFMLEYTPVFSSGLTDKYPGYFSYTGIDLKGTALLKMSLSPFGLHGMILMTDGTTVYIDPLVRDNNEHYQVYNKKNFVKKSGNFSCGISPPEINWDGFEPDSDMGKRQSGDCRFRRYRLALACTGEYAAFHGGTIERVLAAYNNTMTRVNGVYERELGVTMQLIDDTDKLIFTNASTDPYSNTNGSAMLSQNQSTVDDIIGRNNYDIGHVFSTGGGGIASLRSVCTNRKAQGVTGQQRPVGDPFDIDYVAHEIGHQFGANHTQNNNCQRNSLTSMEPGSASTIMGYAGICSPNVQNSSDDYLHAISLQEMQNFIVAGAGGVCAEIIDIENDSPEILTAHTDYFIPISTPFVLTAEASDPNGDILTYCWEQFDNEVSEMPPRGTNTQGPNFRSIEPTTQNSRYFPALGSRNPTWEVLPVVEREMNFRCTVRDNHFPYGCTEETDVRVNTTTSSGPFRVTAPNSQGLAWRVGSQQSVVWSVANTHLPPVSCEEVDIFLSSDGGVSYPYLLASKVANTGQADIVVPNVTTTSARIMVKASDNIFYHTTSVNFRITTSFSMSTSESQFSICDEEFLSFDVDLVEEPGFAGPLLLSLSGLPQSVLTSVQPDRHDVLPASSQVFLQQLDMLSLGSHQIKLTGNAQQETQTLDLSLYKYNTSGEKPHLTLPQNNAINLPPKGLELVWNPFDGIREYRVQVSTHPLLINPEIDFITEFSKVSIDLNDATIYYWRVQPLSPCFSDIWSHTNVFTTEGFATGQPVIVSQNPLVVSRSQTKSFSAEEIQISGENTDLIRLTAVSIPQHGTLLDKGVPIFPGHVLTYADILSGQISYIHDGGSEDRDSSIFNIVDDKNRFLPDWPIEIRIIQMDYSLYSQVFPVTCSDSNDGRISVQVYNGIPPYQYSLDGVIFQDSSVFENLPSGTYDLVVRDNNGEWLREEIIIVQPPLLSLDIEQDYYDFELKGSGGVGILTYSLDNMSFNSLGLLEDPDNGIYTVFVRDELGCIINEELEVNIPALQVGFEVVSDILCAGQKAEIKLTGSGGFAPYSFSADSLSFQSNDTLQLDAGSYFFYIRDAGQKTIVSSNWVSLNPELITINPQRMGLTYTLNGSGGTGPLEYSTDNVEFTTNDTIVFPSNGEYTVFVRDSADCRRQFNIRVNILSQVSIVQRDTRCYNSEDGFLSISPSNGQFPFRYKLNDGNFQTLNRWNNLKAGQYIYVVVDNRGDSISGEVMIGQPDSLNISVFRSEDILRIDASGGTPPYRYSLNGGDSFLDINEFTDLNAGEYVIVVSDNNGCVSQSVVFSTSVSEQEGISIELFPNPASEIIHIRGMASSQTEKLVVRNYFGQILLTLDGITTEEDTYSIDVADWSPGIYFIQLETQKGIHMIKWTKI